MDTWYWQRAWIWKAISSTIMSLSLFSQYVSCDITTPTPMSTSQTNPQDPYSANSIMSKFCSPGTCRNGQCYMVGTETRCYCQSLYRGSRCEQVDLTQVSYVIIENMIIFQWVRPPRLIGYSFVYYELDNSLAALCKTDIIMQGNGRVTLVGNLKGGHTMYRICIEDELVASKIIDSNAVHHLTNCVNVASQPDYHTLIAWCIVAMLVCVAVLLIYLQKDKIELLYFSTPVFVLFEHEHLGITSTSTKSSRPLSDHVTPIANRMRNLSP